MQKSRKEKIELIKNILYGNATINDLNEREWYTWVEIIDGSEYNGLFESREIDKLLTYEQVQNLPDNNNRIIVCKQRQVPEGTPGRLTLNLK